jgi:hypothetical protein
MKRASPKIAKKVSDFGDHAENFYSDKTVHFFNVGFHEMYSTIVTLQRDRALFLISKSFFKAVNAGI